MMKQIQKRHATLADEQFSNRDVLGIVVIKTPASDVVVLALHVLPRLERVEELWIKTGHTTSPKGLRHYIAVHQIYQSSSPIFEQILPAVHTVTGCDAASSVFKIGQNPVFKIIQEKGPPNYCTVTF